MGPSGLLLALNTRTSCLELYHSQEIGFKGKDCIRGVNAILGSRPSVKLLSHASRSSIRVSYYCNSVATFRPIINLIHDIELNPRPFQARAPTRRLLPADSQRRQLQRTCIINKVFLGKILNRNLG